MDGGGGGGSNKMSLLPGSLSGGFNSMHALSEAGTAAGILKHEGIFKIAASLSFKICKMAA